MVQSKEVKGGDLGGDPGDTRVQLVTHQVEGGDIGRSIQEVPGSSEVGVTGSTGHVTPHFEGPDLRGPSRGYPGPYARVLQSWSAQV